MANYKFTRAELNRIIGDAYTDEIGTAIMMLHRGVLDPVLDDLQTAKETADKLPTVQKELDDLKKATEGQTDYKKKYEDLVKENADKATKQAKTDAFRKLLKGLGISAKRIESIVKVSDLDTIKLTDAGEIEGADELGKRMKTEWADFITTQETHGAHPANPPQNNGGDKYSTKEEIMAIKDTAERQREIARHINLFQKGV